ncbi:MAG: ribokinase [Alphaproteobacteria bacterium]|nr:ribokinase [Alphaproteobacteria bacterium]
MAIFNLGSINADYFYGLDHLPAAGETLAADDFIVGLGGKGANQSIAAVFGGAKVIHMGAIGTDGIWARDRLGEIGVDVEHVAVLEMPTGHAIINVDREGENSIVIFSSANVAQDEERIRAALDLARKDDVCILQNETNLVRFTAELAHQKGMRVIYSAAPFDADHAAGVLPFVDLLVVNEVEAAQLSQALGVGADKLPVPEVLITKGGDGAEYRAGATEISVAAFEVQPVDTTGAGDTYLGFFVAGIDAGIDIKGAMTFAAAAAAIQVTRQGTAEAIPKLDEVEEFLEQRLGG